MRNWKYSLARGSREVEFDGEPFCGFASDSTEVPVEVSNGDYAHIAIHYFYVL